jgi:hypothetical protein
LASVQLGDAGLHVDRPRPGDLFYDRLVSREQLFLESRAARGRSLELVVSGLLALTLLENDTADGAAWNGANGSSLRARWEPELREAYVGLYRGDLDVRLGQQRVPWGQSDLFRPNDVLNPRDLRDPVLAETELLSVPVPMARVDVVLGDARLELVGEPFFVPDRVAFEGDNWALVQPDAPAPLRSYLYWADRSADAQVAAGGRAIGDSVGSRPARVADASGGARFLMAGGKVDFAATYHYGFWGLPDVHFDPRLWHALYALDLVHTSQAEFDATARQLQLPPVDIEYVRRHHVGVDAATTAGPLVLRLDGAWDSRRVVYDRFLDGHRTGAVEVVASAEYQTGSLDRTVLVELDYTRLLDDVGPSPLLLTATDSLALGTRARWNWGDLQAELVAIVGLAPASYVARPELGWKHELWTVRAGAVLTGGAALSFGDYFRRNQSLYLAVRRSL